MQIRVIDGIDTNREVTEFLIGCTSFLIYVETVDHVPLFDYTPEGNKFWFYPDSSYFIELIV